MKLVALDISTRAGWAADGATGIPVSGVFKVPTDGDNYGLAYAAFERFVLDLISVHRPTHLAFEAPLVQAGRGGRKLLTNARTVRLLFGLASVAELVGHRAGLTVYEVNVATVKRHFAGHGRADKAAMLARCRQLGWRAIDDNAADALAVYSYARSMLDPGWAPKATPLFAGAA